MFKKEPSYVLPVKTKAKRVTETSRFASLFKRLCVPNYAKLQYFKKTVAFCDFI